MNDKQKASQQVPSSEETARLSLKGCGLAAISFAILIGLIFSGIVVAILYLAYGDNT